MTVRASLEISHLISFLILHKQKASGQDATHAPNYVALLLIFNQAKNTAGDVSSSSKILSQTSTKSAFWPLALWLGCQANRLDISEAPPGAFLPPLTLVLNTQSSSQWKSRRDSWKSLSKEHCILVVWELCIGTKLLSHLQKTGYKRSWILI